MTVREDDLQSGDRHDVGVGVVSILERACRTGVVTGLIDLHEPAESVLYESASVDEIAEAWCRYTARPSDERGDDDPDWWAISFAMTAGMERHPVVQPLLLALVDAAPDEKVVSGIGAGPLEDFISDNEDDLAWLESQAASHPNLANAVRGAWPARSRSPRSPDWTALRGSHSIGLGHAENGRPSWLSLPRRPTVWPASSIRTCRGITRPPR